MYILVLSWFWDWAHYNESVESGSGSWALIRWWLILWGGKTYRIGRPRGLREKVPLARGLGSPTPLASLPSLCEISIVIYPTPPFIFSLHLSVIHVYIWVHVPSATFLALCELLWLPSHCPGVTSTSTGFRGLTVGI